jgi:hypothetical protein
VTSSDSDVAASTTIAPGRLADSARDAATAPVLRLLASYFASAPTWTIVASAALAQGDQGPDELAAALRFRVALASARRLERILEEIAGRLTFRYQRHREESVGAIRGRLDVNRYMTDRGRLDVPRRYPVRVIERDHRTPENVLAAYAALWTSHELSLSSVFAYLPENAPERREAVERRTALLRTLSQPSFESVSAEGRQIWRRGHVELVLDAARRRIDGGHVARPEPYEDLVAWVEKHLVGAVADPGDIEWAFYDERFDPTLFEIWLLNETAAAIERAVGQPPAVTPLRERGAVATFRWKLGTVSVRMHYRWGLGDLKTIVWKRDGVPLRAIPDITILIEDAAANRSVLLVDAKLRRREQLPTEELYKLLGYFDALQEPAWRRGAIIYYAPEEMVATGYVDGEVGRALLLGVDPLRNDSVAFDLLAQEVLGAINAIDAAAIAVAGGADESDEFITRIQDHAVATLLKQAEQLPLGQLAPYERMLEAQLPTLWPLLDDVLKKILVSAEYFGLTAPKDADFSGPLLGLSATCERLLCGSGALFDRIAGRLPGDDLRTPVTFGGAAFLLKRARKPKKPLEIAVAAELAQEGTAVDVSALLALSGELLSLNEERKAAAHIDVIDEQRWRTGRGLILGTTDGSQQGMLPRLAAALKI